MNQEYEEKPWLRQMRIAKDFVKKHIQLVKGEGVLDLIWIYDDGSQEHNVFYEFLDVLEYAVDLGQIFKEQVSILYRPIQEPIAENLDDYYDTCLIIICLYEVFMMINGYIMERWPELRWNGALQSDISQVLETNR